MDLLASLCQSMSRVGCVVENVQEKEPKWLVLRERFQNDDFAAHVFHRRCVGCGKALLPGKVKTQSSPS